jgi:hypothetical protein
VGAPPTPLTVTVLPPLSVSTNSIALHLVGDSTSFTVANASPGGLSMGPTSVFAQGKGRHTQGTPPVTITSVTGGTVAFTTGSTGTSLITVHDSNLDETAGVTVTVDNAEQTQLPSGIFLLYNTNGGGGANPVTDTYTGTVNPGTFASIGSPTGIFPTTFTSGGSTWSITSTTCGTSGPISQTVTDVYGGSFTFGVQVSAITLAYPGSAVGSSVDEAFPGVGLTDTPTGCGGTVQETTSNPNVVSVPAGGIPGPSFTSVAPGFATVGICSPGTNACAYLNMSVTSTTIPILGRGRKEH